MQLLVSEVSAEYYTRPPGILSLLMLTITSRQSPYIYIYKVSSTTIQHIYCTGSLSWHQSHGMMKMENVVSRAGIKPPISDILGQCSIITPLRLPDVITISTPTCLCSALPQRSVQTTT